MVALALYAERSRFFRAFFVHRERRSGSSDRRVQRKPESCISRRQFVIYLVKQIKKMVVIQIKKREEERERQREREKERREAPSGFTSTHLHTKRILVV